MLVFGFSQGTVIQGFISPGRIEKYLPKMKPESVYRLNNFYGSSNKSVYRVSDHAVTVSLSWNSELSVLEDSPTPFDEDRFRFHSFEDFQANCDRKGDLYGNLCYPPHHLFVAVLDVVFVFLAAQHINLEFCLKCVLDL